MVREENSISLKPDGSRRLSSSRCQLYQKMKTHHRRHEDVVKFVSGGRMMESITQQHQQHTLIIDPAPELKFIMLNNGEKYPEQACGESPQRRWQIAVDSLDIFRESINDATNRRLIEKLHRGAEDFRE